MPVWSPQFSISEIGRQGGFTSSTLFMILKKKEQVPIKPKQIKGSFSCDKVRIFVSWHQISLNISWKVVMWEYLDSHGISPSLFSYGICQTFPLTKYFHAIIIASHDFKYHVKTSLNIIPFFFFFMSKVSIDEIHVAILFCDCDEHNDVTTWTTNLAWWAQELRLCGSHLCM